MVTQPQYSFLLRRVLKKTNSEIISMLFLCLIFTVFVPGLIFVVYYYNVKTKTFFKWPSDRKKEGVLGFEPRILIKSLGPLLILLFLRDPIITSQILCQKIAAYRTFNCLGLQRAYQRLQKVYPCHDGIFLFFKNKRNKYLLTLVLWAWEGTWPSSL